MEPRRALWSRCSENYVSCEESLIHTKSFRQQTQFYLIMPLANPIIARFAKHDLCADEFCGLLLVLNWPAADEVQAKLNAFTVSSLPLLYSLLSINFGAGLYM